MLRRDTGTDKMLAISELIYEGAIAFLKRQYTTIGVLAVGNHNVSASAIIHISQL